MTRMTGTELILSLAPALQPAPLFRPTPKAARRGLEFFTAQINNEHTRKAYLNATRHFPEWCDRRGIGQLADVQALHVAGFTAPTMQQHPAALRGPLDWFVTGHILDVNPAHAVRGPKIRHQEGQDARTGEPASCSTASRPSGRRQAARMNPR